MLFVIIDLAISRLVREHDCAHRESCAAASFPKRSRCKEREVMKEASVSALVKTVLEHALTVVLTLTLAAILFSSRPVRTTRGRSDPRAQASR